MNMFLISQKLHKIGKFLKVNLTRDVSNLYKANC